MTQSIFENIILQSEPFMLLGDGVVNICAFDIFWQHHIVNQS